MTDNIRRLQTSKVTAAYHQVRKDDSCVVQEYPGSWLVGWEKKFWSYLPVKMYIYKYKVTFWVHLLSVFDFFDAPFSHAQTYFTWKVIWSVTVMVPNSVYSGPSAVIVSVHTSFSSDTSINRFFSSIWIPTCPLQASSFKHVWIYPTVCLTLSFFPSHTLICSNGLQADVYKLQ